MKSNATSGLPLSICVSVCTLVVLLSVSETVYAKRGCSAFGHSCFGGHGKRFDSHIQGNALQENQVDAATSDKHQEMEPLRLRNEFVIPGRKFEGQEEMLLPQTRRQDSTRFDPFTLSFIVRQWLTSQHRLHQPDVELNNK
ncbi:uncharacterized protein CCHa2 [Bombus flavifrons]|uniref:uncharacterized protein CCHa2 n=1 Tax=Bombus flavifrons TaxID=103934 RepID=UPI0037038EDF